MQLTRDLFAIAKFLFVELQVKLVPKYLLYFCCSIMFALSFSDFQTPSGYPMMPSCIDTLLNNATEHKSWLQFFVRSVRRKAVRRSRSGENRSDAVY